MNIDNVRASIARLTADQPPVYWDSGKGIVDAVEAADFADAVLNPPPSVKQAIWNRANYTAEPMLRQADIDIAEWILPFLTPAAKETT